MPSILIETGFITNKSEGDYLNSFDGKTNISKSISDAILNYKSKLNSDIASTIETISIHGEVIDLELDDLKPVAPPKVNVSSINFKVQISAGSNKLVTKPYNFSGLDQITREKSNSIYRYFYGNTSDYSIAVELLNKAISKGYTTAYLVAYKDGVKTTMKEALKSTEN
jgi:N-acetylmuramoyl-L-alanine amidase